MAVGGAVPRGSTQQTLRSGGWLVAGLALCAVTLSSCTAPPPESTPPNIIVISLDTLRRDAVGLWNDDPEVQTPNLDGLARTTVVFDDAWAQIPFTLPSHMSVFTGLYPDVHGVDRKKSRLSDGVPTLSTILHDAGYNTIGVVTNLWMKGEFGFGRGFDHYQRLPYGLVYADRVNQRAFELVDQRRDSEKPLFLFVHYIDPHSDFHNVETNTLPYYAPPEDLASTGIDPGSLEFCDDDGNCATEFLLTADREGRQLEQATIDRIALLYSRGVSYLDRQIGDLVHGLEERGLWDDALVVIMSDHGEEFREHGLFIHIQPYVENLAIPLMIKLPRGDAAGTRINDTVQTVDLLPTLVDAAGAPCPAHVQGSSLLPVIAGGQSPSRETFGRDKLDRQRFALRNGQFTLIHHLGTGVSELYDRGRDPAELVDIADHHPERVADLESRVLEIVSTNRGLAATLVASIQSATDLLTDEEAAKLRAIGYLE